MNHQSYYQQPPQGPPLSCSQAPKGLDCCCCKRCGVGGCDLKVLDCGCCFHTRCLPLSDKHPLAACPVCHAAFRAIWLMPMSFIEIDEAKAAAAKLAPSGKRGKKRKNATIARLNPSSTLANPVGGSSGSALMEEKTSGESADLRTGRWTTEETAYCDQLIDKFEKGLLPIVDGIKLNDFLANMLKSKQSRLTKKMKNARLSARSYKRSSGFINNDEEARIFSEAESNFFDSIPCSLEKSEIKFHMQKEWRELYSSYCVAINQKLDADGWLTSVEELDRRASEAKDAARMARRKVMMGYALSQDSNNADKGVFIEPNATSETSGNCCSSSTLGAATPNACEMLSGKKRKTGDGPCKRHFSSSPFVGRVVDFLQRYNIPFEHVDAWVPSFVPQQPGASGDSNAGANTGEQKCRLCFAGAATTETIIPANGGSPEPMTAEEHFDLVSFGEYSQKFSFDLGCGLPGRVYSSGIASWEQGIQKAPSTLFERCGGASQWAIQTVLGIPVPSPNVGRVVVLLYSRHDRNRDQDIVNRISAALSKLMPTPKWKLVVDIGMQAQAEASFPAEAIAAGPVDNRANELLLLIRTYTPPDKTSPLAVYLPGFTSLRLLLEKAAKTAREEDLAHTLTESYSSYCRAGRNPSDIAWMVARDYMVLSQQHSPQQQYSQQTQQHQLPPLQQHPSPLQTSYSSSVSTSNFLGNSNGGRSTNQYSLSTQAPAPSIHQHHYSNGQTPGSQQQVVPHSLQQLPPSFDYSQQLPGQPSA